MSRTYVLQSPQIAAAAARMKADVNFIGVTDEATVQWLKENHVFIRDVWFEGELTVRRLQRLYHRLFPGDQLFVDGSLPESILLKAAAYAKERESRVVLILKEGQHASEALIQVADFFVSTDENESMKEQHLSLPAGMNIDAWAGAMALCLMNGLSITDFKEFCSRAAAFSHLPWYDEVAYDD